MTYKIREDIAQEFLGYIAEVMGPGAIKHGDCNWMLPNGKKSSHIEMHDSMFHHLSESFAGRAQDKDSGLHPLKHLACRALMRLYIITHNIRGD